MRAMIGGMLTGAAVSVVGLGGLSVLSETPAGNVPPSAPLVEAPVVEAAPEDVASDNSQPSTPVGSISIVEPQAPDLPEGEATLEQDAPEPQEPEIATPDADTDPPAVPSVTGVEGALDAPDALDTVDVATQPDEPAFPNPQAVAPQLPTTETDLTVSTAPAQPIVVVEPEIVEDADAIVVVEDDPAPEVVDAPTPDIVVVDDALVDAPVEDEAEAASEQTAEDTPPAPEPEEETFVVDLGAALQEAEPLTSSEDIAAAIVPSSEPLIQLGGVNTLMEDRDTGVTVLRPGDDDDAGVEADANGAPQNALAQYAASTADVGNTPLMSVVLVDDGSMSAAAAALAGLPFSVSIGIDAALPNAADLMESYRADGFEVVVLAKLPEGAIPSDVEITFESVFARLPETIAVLDLGDGGLQADRAVTEQAMELLARDGRGFITQSQGLNMAGRAADQAGVPALTIYRDLDSEDQDARVVRRFVDQAAFRARQESGVVLVGRVRPDTISALILWGTANNDEQVAVVPVSAVLNAQ